MEDRSVDTLIVGSGYAGLNAFYSLKGKALLVSNSKTFKFWTAELRKLVDPKLRSETELGFVETKSVKDLDFSSLTVRVDNGIIRAKSLVLSPGCVRPNLLRVLENARKSSDVSLGAQDQYDEYLILQLSFYLRKLGKNVKVYTSYLSWLGEPVENEVKRMLDEVGIGYTENPEDVLDSCTPESPFEFYQANQFLQTKDNVYVAGDIIRGWPKLGELAMRSGKYVGASINGFSGSFKPIFIYILDNGKNIGLHIRSNIPWGGSYVTVRRSWVRSVFKRFIERYYIWRKGNMGFLLKV
ncbi:NAD(P)/FAD-dependent oxidoreductase [Metallosphaera tengchongensis]|uniref:NAD(P)/FAD-dependent oxidoreductase n=1 Tax=Metallosphaera tengchongensis TaxID=1532350 RepID=A0A6N0NX61_9CREN|nr:FAD/NAD(P)-binding oxidoreductase [Metallosphaera tengchongensis]QKQ99690.1 NAD(P)/FAD-dependent oxidoreductase [Metallosphaera tengchongensis]